MTHEQYVSLETAKLLKRAGFDWECRYYYDTWASPTLFDDKSGELKHELHTGTMGICIKPKNYNARPDGAFASAPLQAVAQRWLREVHGVDISPENCNSDEIKTCEWACITSVCYYLRKDAGRGNLVKFPTYEAALEAGLQKCLTLLIEKQ